MVIKMERIEKRIVILYSLRKKQLNNVLEKYQIEYEDYQIIKTLYFAEGISIESLKDRISIDEKIYQHILDNLLNKKYIEIKDDHIYLTNEMQSLYPIIKKKLEYVDNQMMDSFKKEDIEQFIETLDKFIEYYEE